jgi:hypothetical protein
MAWVRALLCKLQKNVYENYYEKFKAFCICSTKLVKKFPVYCYLKKISLLTKLYEVMTKNFKTILIGASKFQPN